MKRLLPVLLLLSLVLPSVAWAACSHSGTVWTCADTGNTTTNKTNAQAAITAAACGETVNIAAGSVLVGTLTFNPNAGCTAKTPVVIQSSAIFSLAKGVRVSPSSLSNMATVKPTSSGQALDLTSARYYRIQGLEITSAGGTAYAPNLIYAGGANDIVLDRMLIRPSEEVTAPTAMWRSAGVGIQALGGVNLTVSNSYCHGFTGYQADNHAAFIQSSCVQMPNDSAGPLLVVNSYLEAYWITFSSGGGGLACNGGCTTVSAATTPTTTQATLASVTGLTVGALVTFQTSGGYQTGQVTSIVGSLVNFSATPAVGWTCTGMTNAPTVGGTAQWAGNNVQNVSLLRNTFASLPLWNTWGMGVDHRNVIFYTGVNIMIKGNTFLGDTYGPLGFFQSGSGKEPWAMISSFTFRDNLVNDIIGVGSSLSTHDTSCKWSGHDILVTNNLWRNIDPASAPGNSGPYFWFYEANGPSGDIAYNTPLTAGHGKTYTHNTVRTNSGGLVASFNGTAQHMNVSDNVLLSGTYGFGITVDVPTNYPNLVATKNVVRNTSGSALGSEFANSYVSSTGAADSYFGFTNLAAADAGGDYHGYVLTGGTSCTSGNWRLCASDGFDPGVNFPAMDAQLLGTCLYSTAMYRCSDLGDVYQNRVAVQAAFDAAVCGDTIELAAGMWIVNPTTAITGSGPQGNPTITVPNPGNCAGNYITVQSSAAGSLPATSRVTTADAQYMATIATETMQPALSYATGAGWYKWIGIQFTNTENLGNATTKGFTDALVFSASSDYTLHDVIYDRVIIRPYEEWGLTNPDSVGVRSAGRGIDFQGGPLTLKNSWVGGFCCQYVNQAGYPNHMAVLATGGLGPFTITNNFLEAYYSNIFTGGASDGGLTLSTRTLSAATATTATVSGTLTGLAVNDIIRLAAKHYINSTSLSTDYIAAKVTGIAGQVVTFAVFGNDNGVDLNTGKCGTSGGDPSPPCAPSLVSGGEIAWKTDRTQIAMNGFTVTRNTLNKRAAWASNSNQCKYFWEIKKGSNILFEGNILTGPVDSALGELCGFGFPIAIQQYGDDPWAEANNLIARSNFMPGVGQIYFNQPYSNHSMQPGHDILFTNNLLGGAAGATATFVVGCSNAPGSSTWTVTHNTVRKRTNKGLIDIDPGCASVANVTFKDNITTFGTGGGAVGQFTPNYVETKNVIIDNSGGGCCPANTATDFVVANDAAVGFTNVAAADAGGSYLGYKLTGGTSCTTGNWRGCASDGFDPGVDFTALAAALSGVVGTTSISGKVTIGGKAGVQ